jgi:hypothetical protein
MLITWRLNIHKKGIERVARKDKKNKSKKKKRKKYKQPKFKKNNNNINYMYVLSIVYCPSSSLPLFSPPLFFRLLFLSFVNLIACTFESETRDDKSFELLPFHYIEVATLLLNHAQDDIPYAPQIRATIEGIQNYCNILVFRFLLVGEQRVNPVFSYIFAQPVVSNSAHVLCQNLVYLRLSSNLAHFFIDMQYRYLEQKGVESTRRSANNRSRNVRSILFYFTK